MNVNNEGERQALCPGCGEMITLESDVQEGEHVSCEICAGSAFRLFRKDDEWALEPLPTASCPVCDELLELDDDIQPGDTVEHCGQVFRLSFEYGAWALDKETAS